MNWKNRLTNYNFWVSIVSAVLLILQALKIKVDFIYVNEVSTAILGLLVVIGIINDPTKSNKTNTKSTAEEIKPYVPSAEEKSSPANAQEIDELVAENENVSIQENDKKFFEIDKNGLKNTEIFENLHENLQNSKIFDENLSEEVEPISKKIENIPEQNVPTDDKDESSNCAVQTDISLDEVSKIEPLKIVN